MDRVDAIVIGAGVVGLAVARALAMAGREVVVIEAESAIGTHTSSRNNEVVHAGFLYAPGTLRARLCRSGRDLLLAYCIDRGIATRAVGKLMPALDDAEIRQLKTLCGQGVACGVVDLNILGADQVAEIEPALRCAAALHSPSTAIVDTHALMLALQADAEACGVVVARSTRVTGGHPENGRVVLEILPGGAAPYELAATCVVNAAGLGASKLAAQLSPLNGDVAPKISYAKGTFFALEGRAPFHHLIVPLGETLAMGGAFTLDLAGRGRFGGDIEWTDRLDYAVDSARVPAAAAAIRRYWPQLDERRLVPDYAGIRPRCWGPNDKPGDWCILGPRQSGAPGVVHLLGIETPGLTACLAIAEHVLRVLQDGA